MTAVISQSKFPVQSFESRFYHGNRYHCISAKVTLDWDEYGELALAPKQAGFEPNDLWREAENRSSLLYPADLIPFKPTTDVLVTGTARPPGGRPAQAWKASLRVGDREKQLILCGPRRWQHRRMIGWILSEPERCDAVPLLYEYAYGGTVDPAKAHYEEGEYYPPNPFGRGYVGKSKPDKQVEHPAAQITAWDDRVEHFGGDVAAGGFGPLPGFVPERLRHAGTYDKAWEDEVRPNIPLDMDMRFWNTAPADQQPKQYLRPGAAITVGGVLPTEQPLYLVMPPIDPMLLRGYKDRRSKASNMHLDTVLVDLDRRQMILRYHGLVAFDPRIGTIQVFCAPHAPLNRS